MKRVSSSRSRSSGSRGFHGSKGSFSGRSSRSSGGSFLSSNRHRSYGVRRYRLWNSLPTWGKVIYVLVAITILVLLRWY